MKHKSAPLTEKSYSNFTAVHNSNHPIYALRRIYGTAWTQIFYFKPLYSAFLSIPTLKKILFRSFGFKGDLSFTVYPDAWIRDLPLLKIGKSVYLANRCTVGTNLCLNDGSTLVGACYFDDYSMVGHLAIFGLGCKLGKHSEIGVSASLGIRVKIGDHVTVSPRSAIYHGASIGSNSRIGACSVIGMKAKIGENIEIKAAAIIPVEAIINTQAEADEIYYNEIKALNNKREALTELLRDNLNESEQGIT